MVTDTLRLLNWYPHYLIYMNVVDVNLWCINQRLKLPQNFQKMR